MSMTWFKSGCLSWRLLKMWLSSRLCFAVEHFEASRTKKIPILKFRAYHVNTVNCGTFGDYLKGVDEYLGPRNSQGKFVDGKT